MNLVTFRQKQYPKYAYYLHHSYYSFVRQKNVVPMKLMITNSQIITQSKYHTSERRKK